MELGKVRSQIRGAAIYSDTYKEEVMCPRNILVSFILKSLVLRGRRQFRGFSKIACVVITVTLLFLLLLGSYAGRLATLAEVCTVQSETYDSNSERNQLYVRHVRHMLTKTTRLASLIKVSIECFRD